MHSSYGRSQRNVNGTFRFHSPLPSPQWVPSSSPFFLVLEERKHHLSSCLSLPGWCLGVAKCGLCQEAWGYFQQLSSWGASNCHRFIAIGLAVWCASAIWVKSSTSLPTEGPSPPHREWKAGFCLVLIALAHSPLWLPDHLFTQFIHSSFIQYSFNKHLLMIYL